MALLRYLVVAEVGAVMHVRVFIRVFIYRSFIDVVYIV